jgi:uncharacterized protein DUF4136
VRVLSSCADQFGTIETSVGSVPSHLIEGLIDACVRALGSVVVMLRNLVVLALLALPAGAAAQVRVDLDRDRDFSQYKTFEVEVGRLVRPDGSTDEQNTLAEDRIRRAVASELAARGLEPTSSNADLIVRVSGRDAERTEIVSSGFRHPSYWYRPVRLRSGRIVYVRSYNYWRDPFYDDVWTRRYLEGALTMDVVDRDTGRLVYRAQVNDEIGNNLDKYVRKSIDRAFKKFPVKERGN